MPHLKRGRGRFVRTSGRGVGALAVARAAASKGSGPEVGFARYEVDGVLSSGGREGDGGVLISSPRPTRRFAFGETTVGSGAAVERGPGVGEAIFVGATGEVYVARGATTGVDTASLLVGNATGSGILDASGADCADTDGIGGALARDVGVGEGTGGPTNTYVSFGDGGTRGVLRGGSRGTT